MLKDGKRIGVMYSVHLLGRTVCSVCTVQLLCAVCSHLKWSAVHCAVCAVCTVQLFEVVCSYCVQSGVQVECSVQLLGSNWQDHPLASALLTHSASLILTAE